MRLLCTNKSQKLNHCKLSRNDGQPVDWLKKKKKTFQCFTKLTKSAESNLVVVVVIVAFFLAFVLPKWKTCGDTYDDVFIWHSYISCFFFFFFIRRMKTSKYQVVFSVLPSIKNGFAHTHTHTHSRRAIKSKNYANQNKKNYQTKLYWCVCIQLNGIKFFALHAYINAVNIYIYVQLKHREKLTYVIAHAFAVMVDVLLLLKKALRLLVEN